MKKQMDLPVESLVNEYRQLEFPADCAVEIDMGCGRGSFAVQLARRYPKRLILATDVMQGRLEITARRARREGADNLRFLRAESGMLMEYQLPVSSVDRVHLLCPDPWPKELPRKGRRLANMNFFNQLTRVLKPGGIFHFSSDNQVYFEDVRQILDNHPHYEAAQEALADIADLKTDFQRLWESQGLNVPHLAYRLRISVSKDR